MPSSMGLWFSVFPTVETLAAQVIAGALVLGSYFLARRRETRRGSGDSPWTAGLPRAHSSTYVR